MEVFQVQDYLTDFKEHAHSSPTREVCGLVVKVSGILTYYKCRNIADKDYDFVMDPVDYAMASTKGTVEYVCHSHNSSSAKPSDVDVRVCNAGSVPWLIYATASFDIFILRPGSRSVPLIGRQYSFGILDCYGLAQDLYKERFNIDLGRPYIDETTWFQHNTNLLEQYANDNGFFKVTDLKEYDLILFKAGSTRVPNHVGIKMEDDKFIHHLAYRLSTKEVYGGYWHKCTVGIYRHKDLKL